MKYTAILLDDEFTSSEVLEYELNNIDVNIEVLGIYEDPVAGLTAIKKMKPDLIFLDIEMPRLNGFEVLDLLKETDNMKVIFVTAYNKYAVEAFQPHVIDYLVKPVSRERLSKAIKKVTTKKNNITQKFIVDLESNFGHEISPNSKIVVSISSGFQSIIIKDILRCEADNNYSHIYLTNGSKILVSKSLIHFEKKLSRANFLRVHQSHLVNMFYVNQYIKTDGGYLILQGGFQVPVSRNYKAKVTTYFKDRLY